MGPITWIFAFSSCVILTESHPQSRLVHRTFHGIPKFPEDFFAFDDFLKGEQNNGDIVDLYEQISDNHTNIPQEKFTHDEIIELPTAGQGVPKINPRMIQEIIISGKPEDAILSVIQTTRDPIEDLSSYSKLETAKVNTEPTVVTNPTETDDDIKKDYLELTKRDDLEQFKKDDPELSKKDEPKETDPELTKNTDYLLVPIATAGKNAVPDQLNPNGGNIVYPIVVQNEQVLPAASTEIQGSNINLGQGVSNQYGTNLPQNQNYVPLNNLPNGGLNNNGGQPVYFVNYPNIDVAPQGNNVPNNMYYVNNPLTTVGYQGTPYKIVPLGYQNNPSNNEGPSNQPIPVVFLNNLQNYPNGYYLQPNNINNQQNYPNNYVYQPNNRNGYIIQPNNVNYPPNNLNGYVQPNNLNNLQNYPNGYVQPNNYNRLNYQQNNPSGYINHPNNLNDLNGYVNQPDNLNNYRYNPNSIVNQPNNYPNNPNYAYYSQPNNQYGYIYQHENSSNQPNSYANQPNNLNNQNNYPSGYQTNNVGPYNNKPNNSNYVTSNKVPVLEHSSDFSEDTILYSLKDKDEADIFISKKENPKQDGQIDEEKVKVLALN